MSLSSIRKQRHRSRGFSHVSQTIEAAAIMGWFVILVLGEKFVGDATTARRSAELSVQESSVASSMGACQGGGVGLGGLGEIGGLGGLGGALSGSVSIGANGTPSVTAGAIPALVAGLGLESLKTLPIYFKPFQATSARASAHGVSAGAPLNFQSGDFEASRSLACLEPSLDSPGAPWVTLEASRTLIFIKTILGYL